MGYVIFQNGNDLVISNKNTNGNIIFETTGSGKIGVLHLIAGSQTGDSAPLKFSAGTNMINPEAGAMEWDGTNLHITQTSGPTRKTISYTDHTHTGVYEPANANIQSHISATGTVHGVSGNVVGTTDTQTLTNKSLNDGSTYFINNADNTKKVKLGLSGITTGTTRTLTAPNSDGTIALTSDISTHAALPNVHHAQQHSIVGSDHTGTLSVDKGGTGVTNTTAYGIICGGITGAANFQNAGAGTSGQFLKSNGANALPSWSALSVTSVFGRTGAVTAQSGDYSSYYVVKDGGNNFSGNTITATTFSGALGATHTRGTGLTGSNYNGSANATWAVDLGTSSTQAAYGNHNHSGVYANASHTHAAGDITSGGANTTVTVVTSIFKNPLNKMSFTTKNLTINAGGCVTSVSAGSDNSTNISWP